MPELSALLTSKRTLTVTVPAGEGETDIQVVYNPSKFTPQFEAELRKMTEGEEKNDSFIQLLDGLILDWDIQHDGEKWPKTLENVGLLPYPVLLPLSRKLMEEILGKETTRKES